MKQTSKKVRAAIDFFRLDKITKWYFPGKEFVINKDVKVIPTPGHTLSDVTVLVTTPDQNIVAVTGNFAEWSKFL